MRISTLMLQKNLTSGLRGRMASIARAAAEASTGRRVRTVSDDPVDASQIMRMESQVRDIDQFRRNGTFATTKLTTEDVALSTVRDVLQRAKTLAMSSTSPDVNDGGRLAALASVRQLKEEMVALGNTRVGNEYIFGGDSSDTPPFQADGTFVGNANSRQIAIGDGVRIALNHSGQPLFTDAIASLDDLIQQLQTGTPEQISASLGGLEDATQQVMRVQAETGARLKEIQETSAALAKQSASLLDRRDALRDVDPAESIIKAQTEQAALERAYAVVSRVLQSTLNDYLR
ncbi:MAG: flagellar hook-associated protein FlgL [Candidatus Eisenbacteria bacterium]|uniref:Flagellar hook-associated protein FlgL n=1 Tax=Eiseniibacteriota bacterium TaxID=2212470 RepID=A0A933SIL7_UNCEI|nr:flagellar hook-associated protein FlgL [Candidatus Eisenbacteria bacterium]